MVAGIGLILLSSVYPNCDRTPEATQGPRRHIRAASLRSNRGGGEFPVRKDTHTRTHTQEGTSGRLKENGVLTEFRFSLYGTKVVLSTLMMALPALLT